MQFCRNVGGANQILHAVKLKMIIIIIINVCIKASLVALCYVALAPPQRHQHLRCLYYSQILFCYYSQIFYSIMNKEFKVKLISFFVLVV